MQAPRPEARRAAFDFDVVFPLAHALVFMAVGLAIHLLFFPIGDIGVESDFYGDLVIAAQHLQAGDFSVTNYPYKGPVYSFALVGVHAIARVLGADWYRSAVILNLLCGAAFLVWLYRMLRGLFPRAVAVTSAIGVSLVYEFFMHGHKASSDLLFLLLFWIAAGLWLPAAGGRGGRARLFTSGAVSGLAFLTRYNGLVLPVAVAAVALLVNPWGWSWRQRAGRYGLYLAAFAAVLAPWYAANLLETGRLSSTRQLQNIFVQEFYAGGQSDSLATGKELDLPAVVRRDPLHFATRYLANVPAHLRLDGDLLLGPGLAVLVVLGLARLLLRPPDRRLTAFLVFPACYFLAMCLVYHQPRFSFPLLPAYLVLAMTVLYGSRPTHTSHWGRWLGQSSLVAALSKVARHLDAPLLRRGEGHHTSLRGVLAALVFAGVLAIQVNGIINGERYYYARRPLHVFAAADFLRERAPREGWRILMARKAHLAHYAGLTYAPFPVDMSTRASFLRDAYGKEVDVIAVSEIERRHYPGVLFLDRLDAAGGVSTIYNHDTVQLHVLHRERGLAEVLSDSLLVAHQTALTQARASDDLPRVVEMGLATGADLMGAGEWTQALPPLEQSLAAATRMGTRLSSDDEAIVKINVSFCLQYLGRHAEGLALLGEDLRALRGDTAPLLRALAHSVLAGHHRALGHVRETVAHLQASRDLYLEGGSPDRAAAMAQEIRALAGG